LAVHEDGDDVVPVLDRDDLQLELARAGEALEQLALEPGVVPPLEGEELGHLVGGDEDAQTTRERRRGKIGGGQGRGEAPHQGGGNESWAAHHEASRTSRPVVATAVPPPRLAGR